MFRGKRMTRNDVNVFDWLLIELYLQKLQFVINCFRFRIGYKVLQNPFPY